MDNNSHNDITADMDSDILADLAVTFPTHGAQLRYLRRLEERCFQELMDASWRTFDAAESRLAAVQAALRDLSPASHAERIRALNFAD
jgi:hypothetical protein